MLAGSAGVLVFACSPRGLEPLQKLLVSAPDVREVDVNFCTDPAQVVKSKLKYVIVLDHSGSNLENYKMDPTTGLPDLATGNIQILPALGTDPQRSARYGDTATPGTLLNFLSTMPPNDPADPSYYFALFTFSGAVSSYPPNISGFTSDIAGFAAKVADSAINTGDSGPTNYLSTLRAAQTLIQSDINLAIQCAGKSKTAAPTPQCPKPGVAVSSTYVLVFMSDGAPILAINGIGKLADGTIVQTGQITVDRQSSREILGTVAGIMGLQSNTRYVDSINLFTIYYYQPSNPDYGASKLLQDMATVGNGVSYDITSGSNIDYRRFTPPQRLLKYTLADVFVTNDNAVFGANGELLLDSDSDGLADPVELELGSDPHNPDSDGNGVSDFVEHALNQTPCAAKAGGVCVKSNSTMNYATNLCVGIKTSPASAAPPPSRAVSNPIAFSASDPDGLNDCEKMLLNDGGGINNPDSNSDLIPDWLEFRNHVPFQLGSSSAADSQDSDGMSYYQKIKTSLPARLPLYKIVSPNPSKYNLNLLSTSTIQDCYELQVTDFPKSGSANTARVEVILKSPLYQDRYLYRVGRKRFSGDGNRLLFNDWNDAGEIAAKTWGSWP